MTRVILWPVELTGPQLAVVRELLSAMVHGATPDVDQGHLIRVAGVKARRLAEVFGGSPAWGTVVVRGEHAGSYRANWPGPRD